MAPYARRRFLPVETGGKLVVAVDESELPALAKLQCCGMAKGVPAAGYANGAPRSWPDRYPSEASPPRCRASSRAGTPTSVTWAHGRRTAIAVDTIQSGIPMGTPIGLAVPISDRRAGATGCPGLNAAQREHFRHLNIRWWRYCQAVVAIDRPHTGARCWASWIRSITGVCDLDRPVQFGCNTRPDGVCGERARQHRGR